jgi:glucose-1-phosphate cytidylyltransferase
MKTIILAGGLGTRISEETTMKPKPMVLIDDKPILWHIMNIYASQGFTDFTIATGYLGDMIHEWVENLDSPWTIQAVDTGLDTQTAGRIRQTFGQITDDTCMVTYGDGLGNINLSKLLTFHNQHKGLATVTKVRPPARFGVIQSMNGLVTEFGEKNKSDSGWINGGFFVLDREVLNFVNTDQESFEFSTLPSLVKQKSLMAYQHDGFWQPMDTLREKNVLTELANLDLVPWLDFKL